MPAQCTAVLDVSAHTTIKYQNVLFTVVVAETIAGKLNVAVAKPQSLLSLARLFLIRKQKLRRPVPSASPLPVIARLRKRAPRPHIPTRPLRDVLASASVFPIKGVNARVTAADLRVIPVAPKAPASLVPPSIRARASVASGVPHTAATVLVA